MQPTPWNNDLLAIKNKIESQFQFVFNSVLINYYRHENDYMSWHSDDEKELGERPVIASISFGGARKFAFKEKSQGAKVEIELSHGSLLIMQGETQQYWKHAIPKSYPKGS